MVDFNSGEVMGTSQDYLIQLLVVEAYYNTLSSVEAYINDDSKGITSIHIHSIKSRLFSLFLIIKGSLKDKIKNLDVEAFQIELFKAEEFKELFDKFNILNDFLYKHGLLKFDSQREVDYTQKGKDDF